MKYSIKGFISFCLAVSMLVIICAEPISLRVSSAPSSVIRDELAALEEEKKKIDTQLADINAQLEESSDEITNILNQKSVIDQEVNLLNIRIANINKQITVYNALIADKQEELDRVIVKYEELREKYKLRIRAMEESGDLTYWQIIFKANSISDFLDRVNIIQEIAAADKRCLMELHNAANDVADAKRALLAEKEELEAVEKELVVSKNDLEVKKVAVDILLQEFLSKTSELETLKAEFEAMEEEFLKQIANKEAEYDEATMREWEEMNSAKPPESNNSGWLVPCSYVYLSSPFGYRDAPVAGASTYHQGVDLAAYGGTPVYATRSGIVTIASHGWSAGNYVQIDHQDGYRSIYMHLENYCVSEGDIVGAGQQIGAVGTSGVSSGYHLHFGISYNGVYVNPCEYVDLY